MKLSIYGSIFGMSGYDTHTYHFARALSEKCDVAVECFKPQGWEFGAPDWLFQALTKDYKHETTIMISTPPFFDYKWADGVKRFIGFVVWEGDSLPEYYIKHLACCDQIWLPSNHVKQALLNTLNKLSIKTSKPLIVIPEGVDSELFKPQIINRDERFTFVCNKGWNPSEGWEDRGGLLYTVKAFINEFKPEEAHIVRLLVKINIAYTQSNTVLEDFTRALGIDKLPDNIEVIASNTPYKELPSIYNQGNVFVLSTRAEGFGLTALEAMSCGLPVITTSYGGQLDFVNEENGWLIDYELTPSKNFLYEQTLWAVPDIKHLQRTMRECLNNKDLVKQKGLNARETALKFSWENAADKALTALKVL